MVIPDSSSWVHFFNSVVNAETEWIDANAGSGRIATADLILCEVLQGFRSDKEFELTLLHLTQFEVLPIGGKEIAIAAAANFRYLRKRGITVRKTIDCLIATFCIENGHSLLHNDRDFDPFEKHLGLQVIHPY